MVLLGRIELPTSPLPRVRSTTELQQRDHLALRIRALCLAGRAVRRGALLAGGRMVVKRGLPLLRAMPCDAISRA